MKSKTKPTADIYSRVTDQILADLEKGVKPWIKPWSAGNTDGRITRPLRHNGTPYAGINVLVLWSAAVAQGFNSPTWMTFRQAKELGANVRKGEKGSLVVYANTMTRTEENENGEEVEQHIPFMKGYTVFNVEQIEELPENYYEVPEPQFDPVARIEHAESFFAGTGATIRHGGNRAFYSRSRDAIQMPHFETFRDAESYYATLAHECTHWTGAKHRMDRDFGSKGFGSEGYAQEELVAELGAAFLCADLEITLEDREDHSSYIASWLKALKEDKRAIFRAAAHAQRAAEYLHSLQEQDRKTA
ncbi:MAG: zincin-like metallopeptidase domain-containing protein [Amphritea sp.]